MRITISIILILFLLLTLVFSCAKPEEKMTDDPAAQAREAKEKEMASEGAYAGIKAGYGDTVTINVFVNLPKYLYLNGPKPLQILIPANIPFKFSKNEYFITKPIFPLNLDFNIERDIKPGIHKIPFATRLMYCNKADDICLIKNVMLEVEFMVVRKSGHVPQKVIITKNIELK